MAKLLVLTMHILLAVLYTMPFAIADPTQKITAAFIFGDSTVDSGNNNWIPTISKANFKPYGVNFPGEKSTGRFSDGKLATDILSQNLGLPDTLPAYLDPEFRGPRILTGASFASAATGLYDGTAKETNVLTIGQQVNLFRRYKAQISAMVGARNATNIISNGVFLMSAGTVDFTNVYYVLNAVRAKYDIPEFQGILLQTMQNFAGTIYEEGGRRLIVLSLPPFGCLPSQITLHNLIGNKCVDYMNQVAVSTNQKLESLVQSFNGRFAGLQATFVNIYDILLDMSLNPLKYGFEEARRGCCGTGLLEASFICNPTTPTCKDATKFVYWDSFHPTTAAYSILARHVMETANL